MGEPMYNAQYQSSNVTTQSQTDLKTITSLMQDDMAAVNAVIQKRLQSDVALINQMGLYIINSGGKRLRPLLALLSARAFGYQGTHHHDVAAIVEFIHTATLLHDDVVDNSDKRRGKDTANNIWGNEAAVLVGDFLYSRSFEMMVDIKSMRIMEILAHSTNTIAEGEVLQLLNCHDADTTEERYLEVIQSKTAKLFESATQLGAVISDRPESDEKAMAAYGMHLGTAFQLIDDVLDYSSNAEELGKNVGDDLAEGKPTLPLIYAMQRGTPEEAKIIRNAIENGGLNDIETVLKTIHATGAIEYTAELAQAEAKKAAAAIEHIPTSPYKDALYTLADFSVNRTY